MPISITALTWMVKNIPNRNTTVDLTEGIDEAGFCQTVQVLSTAHKNIVSVCGSHESDRWSLDDDRLREDYYYEALAFS